MATDTGGSAENKKKHRRASDALRRRAEDDATGYALYRMDDGRVLNGREFIRESRAAASGKKPSAGK